MNDDLISRSALVDILMGKMLYEFQIHDDIERQYNEYLLRAIRYIEHIPSVDAEPVRHGEWLNRLNGMFQMGMCSVCGSVCRDTGRFCPNCGARMDGDGGK